jgi:hypothetical protein
LIDCDRCWRIARGVTPPDQTGGTTEIRIVIGHLKTEHCMDRDYLAGRNADANSAILAAVGYNPPPHVVAHHAVLHIPPSSARPKNPVLHGRLFCLAGSPATSREALK